MKKRIHFIFTVCLLGIVPVFSQAPACKSKLAEIKHNLGLAHQVLNQPGGSYSGQSDRKNGTCLVLQFKNDSLLVGACGFRSDRPLAMRPSPVTQGTYQLTCDNEGSITLVTHGIPELRRLEYEVIQKSKRSPIAPFTYKIVFTQGGKLLLSRPGKDAPTLYFFDATIFNGGS